MRYSVYPFGVCMLGTKEGIEHAILTLKDRFAEQLADLEKEESNDKE